MLVSVAAERGDGRTQRGEVSGERDFLNGGRAQGGRSLFKGGSLPRDVFSLSGRAAGGKDDLKGGMLTAGRMTSKGEC